MSSPGFEIVNKSLFDVPASALCNSINVVGAMGAGIALEFKNRYPIMFSDYRIQCFNKKIKPGDCYTYFDKEHNIYLFGLAVKDDWRHWSTLEWIEASIKSLKLTLLEHDIKSVNIPLLGGKNGRRGPYGPVSGMTPPPEGDVLKELITNSFSDFAFKFGIQVNLCIPSDKPKEDKSMNLSEFFTV
jgi:hypothetical protein